MTYFASKQQAHQHRYFIDADTGDKRCKCGQTPVYLPKVTRTCDNCGRTFLYHRHKTGRRYCSHRCANVAMNAVRSAKIARHGICRQCKRPFARRPSSFGKGSFCSVKCRNLSKHSVSSLKKKVWGVFSQYIRNRDNWTCITCDKRVEGAGMHAGHFISRRFNSTLFDEMNVHAQCAGCNLFRNGQPHIYVERLIARHGQAAVLDLIRRSKIIKQFTKSELLVLHDTYQKRIKDNDYRILKGTRAQMLGN